MRRTVIVGTGSYLPERRVTNLEFAQSEFLDSKGHPFAQANPEIIAKFERITGITERRYVGDDLLTSDIAALSAEAAIADSGIDPESLDYVIVAHNFGDIAADNRRSDMVPSLAARVKARLGIRNPFAVAYDLPFGCPGWLQGVIQADYFLRSGDATRALVIGSETLSRVCDPHDRDRMIYSDGAGAVVLEARETSEPIGILAHATRSDTLEHARLLWMAPSFTNGNGTAATAAPTAEPPLYLKMDGHKVYEYALKHVPDLALECLRRAGLDFAEVDKVLLHQANGKMDDAIARRILAAAKSNRKAEEILPMTVDWLGNSSVATLPTLLDLLVHGQLADHAVEPGDVVLFGSVGAGMNVNAAAYRFPPKA